MPSIPVTPVSYSDAKKIFEHMDGEEVQVCILNIFIQFQYHSISVATLEGRSVCFI